ncbi:T9SS sorting signal type C domain-containing protein [Mangrovimonas spongiae]|uniref:T9SS sorting signal type C domain-containing protein n=1 Tax=Mangrovimonas spongiae TaxID=2494697 RepID=A0A428JY79_9FLAO|nr:T9SS sorting signal type C domain-containing protein [Mangrovimonas spongiae]RSK39106.1 T9SS sorting signal type C domain-containing protein [Mangrovimonas spongiae]
MKNRIYVCLQKRGSLLLILNLYFILSTQTLTGQTILIDPTGNGGFESGTTFAANGWNNSSDVAGTTTNQWTCNTGATTGFSGARSAYITNNTTSTPPPHTYTNNVTNASHLYKDIMVPVGEEFITLSFDWIVDGESTWDHLQIWLVPTSYTPTFGTKIAATGSAPTGHIQISGDFSEQPSWTSDAYSLPPSYAGTTFRLVFEWFNDSSLGGNPPIAIDNIELTSSIPTPPVNDDCTNALTITTNSDLNCTNTTSGTVAFATNSGVNDCTGTSDDDVWFKFTASNTYHSIDLLNVSGSTTNLVHAIYGPINEANCNTEITTANLLQCSDPNSSTLSGLTVGETYYIQVYSYSNSSQTTTFDICVGTSPPPPANDDPCNAISLTVDPGGNCTTSSGTTAYATDSGIVNSSCLTSGDNDDVWYSFVATSAFHNIQISNTGGATDIYHIIYEGTCNGSLTSLSCSDTDSGSSVSGLTIGNTYYVQLFTYSSNIGTSSSFNICTVALEDPCDNIIPLSCDTPTPLSLNTGNGTLESNDCGGWDVEGQEALYSFTPTITGNYSITQFSATTSGSLSSLDNHINYYYKDASLGCDDNNWDCIDHLTSSTTVSTPSFSLTAGITYYFRLDTESTESNDINFQLNCPPPPPGCGLNFYDSGGISGDYGNYENETITICPDISGSSVTVEFLSFLVEGAGTNSCYDNLRIYDGSDATAPQITPASLGLGIGTDGFCWQNASDGTADLTGQSITSTNPTGCLTFVFTSDSSLGLAGWEAEVTCCIVWNGSVDNDWNTAANWSPNEIPTIDDCIIIPDNTTTPNTPILTYPGTPIPPQPGFGLNLTLKDNALLELDNNTELTIKEWVDVQGNAIFNLKNNASLIQIDDVNLNSGNIYVQRAPNTDFSTVSNLEYVYWSSPVSNFDIGAVSPGTNSGLIFEWEPTVTGFGTGNHGYWYNATGNMVNGQGYIIRGLSGTPTSISNTLNPIISIPVTNNTALFSGTPNNGEVIKNVFHGGYNVTGDPGYQGNSSTGTLAYNDDDNWNLIGNPYPSAISADTFLSLNTNIDGTVYLWQHSSLPNTIVDPFYEDYNLNYDPSNYVEYNSSGSIPPGIDDLHIASGQGFFVLANHSAPLSSTVTFNNSMRQYSTEYNNNTFFRENNTNSNSQSTSIERHRVWLDLANSNNMANTLLISYIEGATNEFDRLYDGIEVKSTDLSFYSINNDYRCSIQGRALPFNQEDAIPLGMYLTENDNYSIGINTLEGQFVEDSQNIYLEDMYLNIVHNLKESPYSFTGTIGALNDRFILRYNAYNTLHTNNNSFDNSIIITTPNNQFITIKSNKHLIKTITVYDLLGRPIINKNDITNHSTTINHTFSDGAYIVVVALENGRKKRKKVILKH